MTALLALLPLVLAPVAQEPFAPLDVFELEWAADPQVSPDGSRVVYVRRSFDVMVDRARSRIWMLDLESGEHRPVVADGPDASSPRWSPDGGRLAYVASDEGGRAQVFVRWMDSGATARLTNLPEAPEGLAWSPDGERLAFSMFVEERPEPMAELPPKPEGAEWAEPPIVVERVRWHADGEGLLENGWRQVFVLPAEGGTARQVTRGSFDHGGTPSWGVDGETLVFNANRREDAELEPLDTEVYRLALATGELEELTDRRGPDGEPRVSPDGEWIAYVGFDDRLQGYQRPELYVMRADGSESRSLTAGLDQGVSDPRWAPDGRGVFFRFDEEGNGRIGYVPLDGEPRVVAGNVGASIGRPYGGGGYSVGGGGRFAYTWTRPERPADVAVGGLGGADGNGGGVRVLTALSEDLLAHRELAEVEELWTESSVDGRRVHGWIARPPGFDPDESYPMVLEIHGGPFANYGDRFSAEVQLYAAAGYVVLYGNPRGSTSYGEEFANLIHHAYPGDDYHDLMSLVDAAVERGGVDPDRLFVTGGSGGGVLSAWIVGKTDRFRAAVVAKPVVHWTSFALTADAYPFFVKYWFPGLPWEVPQHYWERSPLSLAGNVSTPTMLLTGEEDRRTPISESEQLYQALKLRGVDTALVRIPGASHGIASRPSRLVAKVAHVLAWFERYAE